MQNPLSFVNPTGTQTAPAIPAPSPGITLPDRIAIPGARALGIVGLILSLSGDTPQCNKYEKECEELNWIDTDTCNAVTRRRGAVAGARCHASASQRHAECLRGGVNGVKTPLDTWNN